MASRILESKHTQIVQKSYSKRDTFKVWAHTEFTASIWVRSRNCGCLVTWFCYQLIAKPGNKTATVSWPEPYSPTGNALSECMLNIHILMDSCWLNMVQPIRNVFIHIFVNGTSSTGRYIPLFNGLWHIELPIRQLDSGKMQNVETFYM